MWSVDLAHDPHDLRRALERARDRLDAARLRAEAARRAYIWGFEPAAFTRDAFHAAMREEADAHLALEAAREALARVSGEALRPRSPMAPS